MEPVHEHNSAVWDRSAASGGRWSTPVTSADVERARAGDVIVQLTPTRPVPADWLPPLAGLEVLGLASAGGQQAPLFAAAGARVTVVDISEGQLALDREVAEREGLDLRTVRGDITDLSAFDDASFDLVFHPSSNSYLRDVRAVWAGAARVLRPGGTLLAGFNNPAVYIFDPGPHDRGVLEVRYPLPFSDADDLPPEERDARVAAGQALEFGHTLEEQIGGQLEAGFELLGFYEDRMESLALATYMATSIATRARRAAA